MVYTAPAPAPGSVFGSGLLLRLRALAPALGSGSTCKSGIQIFLQICTLLPRTYQIMKWNRKFIFLRSLDWGLLCIPTACFIMKITTKAVDSTYSTWMIYYITYSSPLNWPFKGNFCLNFTKHYLFRDRRVDGWPLMDSIWPTVGLTGLYYFIGKDDLLVLLPSDLKHELL